VPASASGQPLPSCGYLPAARLRPLQTASQLIPLRQPTASCLLRKSQSILHHASKGASRAESIEQLTEESDQNQPTVDLANLAGWGYS
jgi:hypothetical protein